MAFRADIVKMVEDLVTKIEEHHFKVNSSMKQDFVTFVNSFFKFHLDQPDINFNLNANMLYADTDGVKVIIATDSTMAFAVPGCTIPMRDQIEAFIVVDEVVAYDSYKMRRFRKAIQDPPAPAQTICLRPPRQYRLRQQLLIIFLQRQQQRRQLLMSRPQRLLHQRLRLFLRRLLQLQRLLLLTFPHPLLNPRLPY